MLKAACAPGRIASRPARLLTATVLAGRSGGRVGGSGGFRAKKAQVVEKTQVSKSVTNNTVIVAPPPVYSPFGFSPFGFSPFGGFSIMPTFFFPIGPLFGIIFVVILFSFLSSVIGGMMSGGGGNSGSSNKKDKGDWGDL